MPAGLLPNLNSAFRFGVQKALRGKQGQTRYLIEASPLKKAQAFQRGSGNYWNRHITAGALSQAHSHTSAIVLGSSAKASRYCKRNMAASGSVASSGDLVVDSLISSCSSVSSIGRSSGVYFSNTGRNICQKACLSVRNGKAKNGGIFCGYFVYDITPKALVCSLFKSYNTSSSTCYSNGDATQVSTDGSSSDEQIASIAISDDQYVPDPCVYLISLCWLYCERTVPTVTHFFMTISSALVLS